jgi:hypothetical protein
MSVNNAVELGAPNEGSKHMEAIANPAATAGSDDPVAADDRLPPVNTTRWVARRKAEVLAAITDGRLTRAAACARYSISEAELRLWERAVECAGVPGLRVTRVQIYRPVFEARSGR